MKRTKRRVVSWNGKVSKLIRLVERRGGVFHLSPRGVVCRNCPRGYVPALRENAYLILAILRERQAAIDWERDFACHCPDRPFAHPAHRPKDIWEELLNNRNAVGKDGVTNNP